MFRTRNAQENRFALTASALAIISASTFHAGTGRLPYKNDVLLGAGGLNAADGMAEPGAAPVGTPSAGLLAENALAKDGISAMTDKGLPGAGSPPNADGMDVTGNITATAKVGISEPGAKMDD